jgi:hypothetical protein
LKNRTVFDSAKYYVFGHFPFVNGKPANIQHNDTDIEEMIRRIFPVDRIEAVWITFRFLVPGNKNSDITPVNLYKLNAIMQLGIEVERVGAPDDPVEGSNVTLICTCFAISSNYYSRDPPTWFYCANGNATWHEFSKYVLKEPNAGILTL